MNCSPKRWCDLSHGHILINGSFYLCCCGLESSFWYVYLFPQYNFHDILHLGICCDKVHYSYVKNQFCLWLEIWLTVSRSCNLSLYLHLLVVFSLTVFFILDSNLWPWFPEYGTINCSVCWVSLLCGFIVFLLCWLRKFLINYIVNDFEWKIVTFCKGIS